MFNVSSDQWAIADNGGNNCTAVLSGQDFGGESFWIFGQGKKEQEPFLPEWRLYADTYRFSSLLHWVVC